MDTPQRIDRNRTRDQIQTSLRAIAILNRDHSVQAAPIKLVRGTRGRPSYTTLTFHVDTPAYFAALREVQAMEERRAG
ncbi:MAG: hypothetical protein M0R75_13345 [Dehalococcoidia bacterium]|nr:hypothetical protein [Dehalococcoidia bacterium]